MDVPLHERTIGCMNVKMDKGEKQGRKGWINITIICVPKQSDIVYSVYFASHVMRLTMISLSFPCGMAIDTDSFHTGARLSYTTLVLNFLELFTRTTQNGSLSPKTKKQRTEI